MFPVEKSSINIKLLKLVKHFSLGMIKTAVVLAGGKGVRLRPLTLTTPKPLLPVGNVPILDHILSLLYRHGFEKVIVAVNYLGEKIVNHLVARWMDKGLEIVAPPLNPADTADAVRKCASYIDEDFLVTMGDVVTNMDLRSFAYFHESSGSIASIALIEVQSLRDFGAVLLDGNGAVLHFLEKPGVQEMYVASLAFAFTGTSRKVNLFANLANSGFYAFRYDILDVLRENPHLMDFGKNVFPWLLENNYRVKGWLAEETYWIDVGRPESYLTANFDLLAGHASPLRPYGRFVDGVYVGEGVEVSPGARIIPPVALGDNVRISQNAEVGPYAVIGSDTHIGVEAHVSYSVLMGEDTVERGAHVRYSVLAKSIKVGEGAVVRENSVLGEGVVVKEGSIVGPGTRIGGGIEVMVA